MDIFKLVIVGLLLLACEESQIQTADNEILVGIDQTVSKHINGQDWVVTFSSIEENSFCPEGVVCVWQGRFIVVLQVNGASAMLGLGDLRTFGEEPAVKNSIMIDDTNITFAEAIDTETASTTKIKLQFD
ncbi:MAG: hypothetical protein ABJG47_06275 [Ekhidna sp.]